MRNNLIAYIRLTATKRNDFFDKLGEPTLIDENYIFYRINQTMLSEMLTLPTKTLLIEFAEDCTGRTSKIHE